MNNIPYKYDGRYIINDTLSRMCQMLNSEQFIEKIINSTQLPYLFTNNPIPLEFNYLPYESMLKETYCKFSWILSNKDIPFSLYLSFDLAENTLEKNILLYFGIEIVKPNLIPEIYIKKNKKCNASNMFGGGG